MSAPSSSAKYYAMCALQLAAPFNKFNWQSDGFTNVRQGDAVTGAAPEKRRNNPAEPGKKETKWEPRFIVNKSH